jgi:hypothetical protein
MIPTMASLWRIATLFLALEAVLIAGQYPGKGSPKGGGRGRGFPKAVTAGCVATDPTEAAATCTSTEAVSAAETTEASASVAPKGIATGSPKLPHSTAPKPPSSAAPKPPSSAAPKPPSSAAPKPSPSAAPRPSPSAAPQGGSPKPKGVSSGCTATSFGEIAAMAASCATTTIKDVAVPVGGQIKLEGLTGKTVKTLLYPLANTNK